MYVVLIITTSMFMNTNTLVEQLIVSQTSFLSTIKFHIKI